MKQPRYHLVVTGLAFATAFSLALGAAAQVTDTPGAAAAPVAVDSAAQATQARIAASPIPAEFGTTSNSILQIGVAAFHGRSPAATLTYIGTGLSQANITGYNYWAPFNLPEGTIITFLDLYACDTNATNHMTATMTGYSGSGTPLTTDFWGVSSTNSGCNYWISSPPTPPFVVNNNVRYSLGYDYVINLSFGAADATNQFKGVDIWWKRQVSPGPATATFADVPTGASQFKFVEALYAAGITAGCATGPPLLYCPNTAVTRGQMAVFLSLALGLHWPN